MLHPPPSESDGGGTSQSQLNREGQRFNTIGGSNSETSNQDGIHVTAATGAGERVCLSVVPLKVQVKGSDLPPVETYALLDSGSEVTFAAETWCEWSKAQLYIIRNDRIHKGGKSTARHCCDVNG